jgi:hypothetical protein
VPPPVDRTTIRDRRERGVALDYTETRYAAARCAFEAVVRREDAGDLAGEGRALP